MASFSPVRTSEVYSTWRLRWRTCMYRQGTSYESCEVWSHNDSEGRFFGTEQGRSWRCWDSVHGGDLQVAASAQARSNSNCVLS
jgi:hypothetical protein